MASDLDLGWRADDFGPDVYFVRADCTHDPVDCSGVLLAALVLLRAIEQLTDYGQRSVRRKVFTYIFDTRS